MSQYTTGTVDTTHESNIVTGNSTAWLAGVEAGDLIRIGGDSVFFQIASVDSDTQLTLTANYNETLSEEEYVIVSDFTSTYNIPLLNQGDMGAAEVYSRAMLIIDQILGSGGGGDTDTFEKDALTEEGVLEITHALNRVITDVTICDNEGVRVSPGRVSYPSDTQTDVDLAEFYDSMVGEWRYLIR